MRAGLCAISVGELSNSPVADADARTLTCGEQCVEHPHTVSATHVVSAVWHHASFTTRCEGGEGSAK
eukprot:2582051-Prymnesium_polylepis.1